MPAMDAPLGNNDLTFQRYRLRRQTLETNPGQWRDTPVPAIGIHFEKFLDLGKPDPGYDTAPWQIAMPVEGAVHRIKTGLG